MEVSGSAMKGYENYKELHLRQPVSQVRLKINMSHMKIRYLTS